MFRTVPLSIIRSFSLYTQQWCMSYSLRAGSGRNCSQAVSKSVWHIPLLCVQWETPDDGQRNCPKHVEFYSRNTFEKLVHLVSFYYKNLSSTCFVQVIVHQQDVISGHWTFICSKHVQNNYSIFFTNLIHKFFISIHLLHSTTCFEHNSW